MRGRAAGRGPGLSRGLGGAVAEIDTNGVEALRRTIAEGKPNVVQIQTPEDASHLRVLLTVPMRRADGAVAGALAAVSKLPLATLIPEPLGALPCSVGADAPLADKGQAPGLRTAREEAALLHPPVGGDTRQDLLVVRFLQRDGPRGAGCYA